jgi:hypothetical protein
VEEGERVSRVPRTAALDSSSLGDLAAMAPRSVFSSFRRLPSPGVLPVDWRWVGDPLRVVYFLLLGRREEAALRVERSGTVLLHGGLNPQF